jgi:protein SCO1/2
MSRMQAVARLATSLILGTMLAGALSACSEQAVKFKSSDITGMTFSGDFSLTDHTGKPRTLNDFKGKVIVLFFGYTQCPDVCPTTLSEVAAALKELGATANDVQVLFVTVDPERDTRELLAQYVPAFNPSFLGLRGNQAELDTATKLFKVFYQKVPSNVAGSYTMDHSAGSFVFDKQGRIRLLVSYGAGASVFAHDLGQLLKQ